METFKEIMTKKQEKWTKREEEKKNIQTLVLQCLQNKDISKARELLLEGTLDGPPPAKCLFSDNELMKLFEQYPPDNILCPICKKNTIKHIFNGHRLKWIPTNFCKSCKMLEYKTILNEEIDKIMEDVVSKRYWSARINDFPVIYKDLYKKENGLFFYGARGVGKTHLMAAMAREIILNSEPFITSNYDGKEYRMSDSCKPLFISTPELLMQIRNCFNNKNSEGGVTEEILLDEYSRVEVLMLDDLGAEKPTEWVLQTLYLIIDRRYRSMKKTIVSSNYNLSQIAKRLDDRISSRIAGMCQIVQMTGKDRRL